MSVDRQQVRYEEIDAEVKSGSRLYLTFRLQDEDYGIVVDHVTEIIGMQKITQVPGMPREIKGVLNLRGKIIPLMDARIRFGMPERECDERTCVIVTQVDETTMGLMVDRVKEVVDIAAEQISDSASTSQGDYIEGLAKFDKDVKILLNVRALVDSEEYALAEAC